MILRKPYAFFIKYFRLLNLIMAIFMGIIIYRTFVISKFLTDYINDYTIANAGFNVSKYMSFYSFIIVLLIIILTIIITSVMFVKNKPKKLYIINLVVYFLVIVLYMVDYSLINSMNSQILDIRVSKALRDVNYILLAIQIVSFILTLVRATGFDIKSFDFASDLQGLDIDTKDNEEFEVAVEFDKNKVKRDFRKNLREIKYFYFEHKFFVNVSVIIVAVIITFIVFMNKNIYNANYGERQTFQASGLSVMVNNSYITKKDQQGNNILSDGYLVAVNFDVKRLYSSSKTLNTGLITLEVDGNSYGQTANYNNYITDLGTGYVDQKLSDDFVSYLVTFKIPEDSKNKSMRLKFNDNVSYVRGEIGAKNIYIKLNPKDLTKNSEVVETNFKDTLVFSDSILEDTSLKITKADVSNKFKATYNFCSMKDKCFESYEYITPTATGNYFKTLLRLELDYELDENLNNDRYDDFYNLINTFGILYYQVDGKWNNQRISSETIRPKVADEGNVIYVEVNKDAERAISMYLEFKIRNYTYKYMLK